MVQRKVSGGTTNYYVSNDYEIKNGVATKYIFAGNLRVAQVKGTNRSFFHKDHLGSSAVMTDASGYEIESTEYVKMGTINNIISF